MCAARLSSRFARVLLIFLGVCVVFVFLGCKNYTSNFRWREGFLNSKESSKENTGSAFVSLHHTEGQDPVPLHHTEGQDPVPPHHAQGQDLVPPHHVQGQDPVPPHHVQGQDPVPPHHVQGQDPVPPHHVQGQDPVPPHHVQGQDPVEDETILTTQKSQKYQLGSVTSSLPIPFDPHGNDTLVVIHTQKTGGSEFGKHVVTVQRNGRYLCSLDPAVKMKVEESNKVPKVRANRGGKRRTACPRDPTFPNGEQWLVAPKTVRWVCGLHASFSEYRACLPHLSSPNINPHRRLHYAILLRHPVLRYLSEYLHVQRNATWAAAQHMCRGKPVSQADMPPCYPGFYRGEPWEKVTLSKYVACDSNWANNRQTMMLADMEAVHCFNRSALTEQERDRRLLETAMQNLKAFTYFGITEYMNESCLLFEKMFDMTFAVRPEPYISLSEFRSGPLLVNLRANKELYNAILQRNHLDLQLYEFALGLFAEKARTAGIPVNPNYVEQEVEKLTSDPQLVDNVINGHKGLNYTVS